MKLFIAFLFIALLHLPFSTAQACINPNGDAGTLVYNEDYKSMQFCDGVEWQTMKGAGPVFAFEDQAGVATSTDIESNIIVISDIPSGLTVAIVGDGSPEYRICADSSCASVNHAWNSGETGIDAGEYLQIRLTSSATADARHSATTYIGFGSFRWDVTMGGGGGGGGSPTNCPSIGDTCDDGSIYAGLSPDGNVPMFTTPADAASTYTWNDGSSNWLDTAMVNCTDASPGTATSCQTGEANTALLVGLSGSGTPAPYDAAEYCDGLSAHGYDGWYLPAQDELNVLYDNLVDQDGDNTPGGPLGSTFGFNITGSFPAGYYWSSSEYATSGARGQRFSDGTQSSNIKYNGLSVRCVRR